METKLKRMPFSVDLAKKITEGKIKGAKIKTEIGLDARILAFDINSEYLIAAIIRDTNGLEKVSSYTNKGSYYNSDSENDNNLCLYVPTSYKDYSNFEPQKWQAVLVRNFDTDKWLARVATGKKESNGFYVLAVHGEMQFFSHCLPISKTTIKLLGTTKSYEELKEE